MWIFTKWLTTPLLLMTPLELIIGVLEVCTLLAIIQIIFKKIEIKNKKGGNSNVKRRKRQ